MKKRRKRIKRLDPVKDGGQYRQLWRIVDGAIIDAFRMHPDYLTPKGSFMHTARRSIAKRVTGAIMGFAEQSARGPARSSCLPRAECASMMVQASDALAPQTSLVAPGAGLVSSEARS